jgi:hypothetical protein
MSKILDQTDRKAIQEDWFNRGYMVKCDEDTERELEYGCCHDYQLAKMLREEEEEFEE